MDASIKKLDIGSISRCVGDNVVCENDRNSPRLFDVLQEKHNKIVATFRDKCSKGALTGMVIKGWKQLAVVEKCLDGRELFKIIRA